MRSIPFVSVCLLLATMACGDDDSPARPDARVFEDAEQQIDAPMMIPCSYTEMADATNDDLFGSGTAETSGLSFTGTTVALCGQINNGHFNATDENVDVDSFRFTVPAQTRGIIYLTATGASALESSAIEISGITTTVGVSEIGVMQDADFAVTAAELPVGDYLLTMSAYNATDAAAAIDYRITIVLDSDTRCAKSTATANFTEANDGALASGNDVYEVDYGNNPRASFTQLGNDAAEPTGITVTPDTTYRVSGVNSSPVTAPVSWQDDYQDRDTYQITMGANTNTLAVRVNWPGTTADLDFFVFPMGSVNDIARGWDNRNMEDELTTLAVTPGQTYMVWVAADDASTGQPINYDVTLCGSTFSPPTTMKAPISSTLRGPRRHLALERRVRPLSK